MRKRVVKSIAVIIKAILFGFF